jgi:hypothetical protein
MALSRFDIFARSVVGPSAAGTQVYICEQPATTSTIPPSPLAQVYSDPLGANPVTQPIVCDGFGHAYGYVAAGVYTEVLVYLGYVAQVLPDQYISNSVAVQVNGVEVNGNPVTGPNFNSSAPSIPSGSTAVNFAYDASGNVSGSVITSTFAPLNSPIFTGTPQAPTPATSDDSNNIATTAYVQAQLSGSTVTSVFGRTGVVAAQTGDYTVAQITGAAPLASPALTGVPTAPTPLTSDSSTTIATTAYVKAQAAGLGTVTSFSAANIGSIATAAVVNSTTTPALTYTLDTQNANTVWAGPVSGSSASPTFRSLVNADIATLSITGLNTNGTSAASPTPATPTVFNITASTANGASPSVVTITASNNLVAGQLVGIAGTGEISLNGNTYTVLTTGLSSTQFQINGANGLSYTNPSDTGTATLYLVPQGATAFWYAQNNAGNWFPQAFIDYTTTNSESTTGWTANTALTQTFYFVDPSGYVQGVTTSGTTGATQPSWNETLAGTTNDNTVVWTNFGWVGSTGTLTLCHRLFIRDNGATAQVGKNAMVSLNHLAGVQTSKDNQDRALWVSMANQASDTSSIYAMACIQTELDLNGSPNFVSAVDGEVTAVSIQLNDGHTGAITAPNGGVNCLKCTNFRLSGSGTWGSVEPTAGKFLYNNGSTTSAGNLTGVYVLVDDGTNTNISATGIGVHIIAPSSGTRFSNNLAIRIENYGANLNDYAIYAAGDAQSWLGGPVGLSALYPTGTTGIIPISASVSTQGLLINQLAVPENPNITAVGTTGSTTYTYVVVALDVNGNTVTGVTQTITNGNATLSGTNYNLVQLSSPYPLGAVSYNVYRTVGGATQGKIGNITPNSANSSYGSSISINDTGLVADGTTTPSLNTTGSVVAQGSAVVGFGGYSVSISNIAESSLNVVTLTVGTNSFVPNQSVTLQGLTTGTWLNGASITLTTVLSGTITFVDPTSHGFQASHSETGTITPVAYGGVGVFLVATSAITGAVPVKADTSNANQVVETTTSDTGAGKVIGVCINSPAAGGFAQVVTSGVVPMTLGSGTIAVGNPIGVDTVTAGRVKAISYTAGEVIGTALSAQSTVGNTFNVMVGLR